MMWFLENGSISISDLFWYLTDCSDIVSSHLIVLYREIETGKKNVVVVVNIFSKINKISAIIHNLSCYMKTRKFNPYIHGRASPDNKHTCHIGSLY